MYEIKRAWKDDERRIIFHDTGSPPHAIYRAIHAGLSWLNKDAPGYYCIVGQRDVKNERAEYPLLLLREGESDDLQELFRTLTDDAAMLLCEEVYTDLSAEWEGFADAFRRYRDENKIKEISLQKAPYVENFQYGVSLIFKWIKHDRALEIERGTILQQQLGRIPKGDLGEDPEVEYHAVNALRYVLAAYEKYGRDPIIKVNVGRFGRPYGPHGWMAS